MDIDSNARQLVEPQSGAWPVEYLGDCYDSYVAIVCENDPVTGATVIAHSRDNLLHIVGGTGDPLPGWPVDVYSITGGYYAKRPVFGDIDGDGDLEILAMNFNNSGFDYVLAWHIESGELVDHWPVIISSDLGDLALSDLDNDNDMEVLIAREEIWHGKSLIFALQGDGTLFEDWPVIADEVTHHLEHSQIASADIDCDGYKEVIVSFGHEYLHDLQPSPVCVYDFKGHLKWKYITDGYIRETCVGNVDDDPELELVILYDYEYDKGEKSGTMVLDHDGTIVPGWEPKIWYSAYSMVIADIDLDNKMEVLVSCYGRLKVHDHDGAIMWVNENIDIGSNLLVGNILGDGRPEIIFGPAYGHCVTALNGEGTAVLSLPLVPEKYDNTFNLIWDLDKDGDVELVTWLYGWFNPIVSKLCAWDLPFKVGDFNPDWPMYRHDAQHSGVNAE